MANQKLTFTELLVEKTARPLWYFLFMLVPIACSALAYEQSIGYALIRQELKETPEKIDQGLDYLTLVLQKESNLSTWLLLTVAFYLPFLLTIIVNYTKLDWKKVVNGMLKKFLTSFGFTICLMTISQFGLGVAAFSVKGLAPYVVFLGLMFSVLVLLEKWSTTEIDAIGRTVLGTLSALSIILTVLLLTKLNVKPGLDTEISAGLWKDLFLISIIYLLLVAFGTWIVTRFSVDPSDAALASVDKSRYSLPVVLIMLFIIVSIITLWFEVSWRNHGFVDVTQKIYNGKISETKIGVLWSFHNQHIMVRSLLTLFIGTVISTSFSTLLKMGAHKAWMTNKLQTSQSPTDQN